MSVITIIIITLSPIIVITHNWMVSKSLSLTEMKWTQ